MSITNVTVVNTTSKYIVKSTGIGYETDEELVNAKELIAGTNESKVSLIECYYLIENVGSTAGKLTIGAGDETLPLDGKGKYGLRPGQLKFGNDKLFKLTTDSNVRSYLLVTEFRRNLMADAVTSQTLVDTSGTKTVMKFTNMSDGSGETLVTKMDASALTFMTEDATKSIAKIWWAVNTTNGKSGVELLWAGSGSSAANSTIAFFIW